MWLLWTGNGFDQPDNHVGMIAATVCPIYTGTNRIQGTVLIYFSAEPEIGVFLKKFIKPHIVWTIAGKVQADHAVN